MGSTWGDSGKSCVEDFASMMLIVVAVVLNVIS